MAELTPKQIEAAKNNGAEITVIPKAVHVDGLKDLVAQMQSMQEAGRKAQSVMLMAIQQLTQVIQDKKMSSDTDLSELILAVEGLHRETEESYEPVEWELTFERDNRGMLQSGMRFTPVQKTIY